MTRRSFIAAGSVAASALGAAPASRSAFGVARDSFRFNPVKDTYEFLERCHGLGAAGIQCPLTDLDPAYIKRLRDRAGQLGMYIELQGPLPKANMEGFAALLKAARDLGARAIRTVNPGPRRYEAFQSLDDWKAAAADAEATLRRALPLVNSMRIPIAIENHRDWTLEEFERRMRRYAGEYLGCCVDLGNNLALLDLPQTVAEALAPYAISTHIKDVGVAGTDDGFTFTEVPLGTGIIDVKRAIATIRAKRPDAPLILEMITRDPTPVPCLSERYWAMMPGRTGLDLARTLSLVRGRSSRLPAVTKLPEAERVRIEEDNVRRCLAFPLS